jgi:hypothetical protein
LFETETVLASSGLYGPNQISLSLVEPDSTAAIESVLGRFQSMQIRVISGSGFRFSFLHDIIKLQWKNKTNFKNLKDSSFVKSLRTSRENI